MCVCVCVCVQVVLARLYNRVGDRASTVAILTAGSKRMPKERMFKHLKNIFNLQYEGYEEEKEAPVKKKKRPVTPPLVALPQMPTLLPVRPPSPQIRIQPQICVAISPRSTIAAVRRQ